MGITLSHSELNDMLFKAGQAGANYALQKAGVIKSTLTRTEVVHLHGRARYEESLKFITWQKKGNGKTSPVICQRDDFEKWITIFDAEQKERKIA